ncbi:MAG: recombination protein RecR [Parcubacteria group bacterium]|nr:MAG: recombination protein RecR [Parcubacteria group bacterium]
MKHLPDYIQRIIDDFDKLPGIGPKTASRLVFSLLNRKDDVQRFSENLAEAYQKVNYCEQCYNLTDKKFCSICSDPQRDQTVVCVVGHNQDVDSIEKTNQYNGLYHLLNGLLSPLEGVTPDDLKINELLKRIEKKELKEIILALDQSLEGEATAIYLTKILKKYPSVIVSQLARGIPMGANIEYTDEVTLSSALKNRNKL